MTDILFLTVREDRGTGTGLHWKLTPLLNLAQFSEQCGWGVGNRGAVSLGHTSHLAPDYLEWDRKRFPNLAAVFHGGALKFFFERILLSLFWLLVLSEQKTKCINITALLLWR